MPKRTIDKDGLVCREDGHIHATIIDGFRTGLGIGKAKSMVILQLRRHRQLSGRLNNTPERALLAGDLTQFALSARRAEELGRHLLELAAQIEKEQTGASEH